MYVKRVFYDDFKDLSNVEKSIEFPTWEDIEKVINLLDGEYVTQITMDNGNEDDYLCIGGGNDGLCNVFISKNDNEIIYTLMNSDANDSLVHKLVTGGQEGNFEDKLCVSIEIAKCVAKMYYELGQMDDSFIWEQFLNKGIY